MFSRSTLTCKTFLQAKYPTIILVHTCTTSQSYAHENALGKYGYVNFNMILCIVFYLLLKVFIFTGNFPEVQINAAFHNSDSNDMLTSLPAS